MARYWFQPKRYGYGVTPVTWEGWALTGLLAALLVISIVAMKLWVDRSNFVAWIVWAAIAAGVTVWFARVARQRTDGDWRWRWDGDHGARPR